MGVDARRSVASRARKPDQEVKLRFPTSVRGGGSSTPSGGMQMWVDAAQAQIDEPVIAACIFSRPSNVLASKAASSFGLIGHLALKKSREVRAGGLPPHFIVAITAQHAIALRRTMRAGRNLAGEPGEEVARWDRNSLRVDWKRGSLGYSYDVTIESPSEAEKVECSVGLSPESEEFPPPPEQSRGEFVTIHVRRTGSRSSWAWLALWIVLVLVALATGYFGLNP